MTKTKPAAPRQAQPMFPKDYWDRPPLDPKDRGDPSGDAIYRAVGLALSRWEEAENVLAHIFGIMSECQTATSQMAAQRAFGSIETSTGRRKMLAAVAEVYFGHSWTEKAVKGPFNHLIEAFAAASGRRDDIAHGIARCITINGNPRGWFLWPAEYNTGRNALSRGTDPADLLSIMPGRFRYTSATIMDFAKRFGALMMKAVEYAGDIHKVAGRPKQVLSSLGLSSGQIEALEKAGAEAKLGGLPVEVPQPGRKNPA
jgi:hypothetical protein